MKVQIKVHVNSSQEKVVKIGENELAPLGVPQNTKLWGKIWIKEKPIDGKANSAIEKLMKKYFNAGCEVVSGFSSRNKIIEVKNEL